MLLNQPTILRVVGFCVKEKLDLIRKLWYNSHKEGEAYELTIQTGG